MPSYWDARRSALRERVSKFNPYHEPAGSSIGGRFTTADRAGGGQGTLPGILTGSGGKKAARFALKKVTRTSDIKEALRLIQKGEDVELESVEQVHTLLNELHKVANDMAAKGDDAPNFNLCKVSVAGTNLFCAEHQGIKRAEMPQLAGEPVKGTRADKLERRRGNEVDGIDDFKKALKEGGRKVTRKKVPAATLKATQEELVGAKVAGMMNNADFDPANAPIFVSRDGYVIDGHHRWATQVGRDAGDNKLGDLEMDVFVVDAPISAVIRFANDWAADFGIKAKAATADAGHVGKGCLGCADDARPKATTPTPTSMSAI